MSNFNSNSGDSWQDGSQPNERGRGRGRGQGRGHPDQEQNTQRQGYPPYHFTLPNSGSPFQLAAPSSFGPGQNIPSPFFDPRWTVQSTAPPAQRFTSPNHRSPVHYGDPSFGAGHNMPSLSSSDSSFYHDQGQPQTRMGPETPAHSFTPTYSPTFLGQHATHAFGGGSSARNTPSFYNNGPQLSGVDPASSPLRSRSVGQRWLGYDAPETPGSSYAPSAKYIGTPANITAYEAIEMYRRDLENYAIGGGPDFLWRVRRILSSVTYAGPQLSPTGLPATEAVSAFRRDVRKYGPAAGQIHPETVGAMVDDVSYQGDLQVSGFWQLRTASGAPQTPVPSTTLQKAGGMTARDARPYVDTGSADTDPGHLQPPGQQQPGQIQDSRESTGSEEEGEEEG